MWLHVVNVLLAVYIWLIGPQHSIAELYIASVAINALLVARSLKAMISRST